MLPMVRGNPSKAAARPWADRITVAWNKARDGVFEVGRLLIDAKAALPHGKFTRMIENALPFSAGTAQRLMKIASDPRLANPAHVPHLPASWGTLHELTKLKGSTFADAIERGVIRPDMERQDVTAYLNQRRREANASGDFNSCTVADLNKLIKCGHPFGTIYADPPWQYDEGVPRGAAVNHYNTMTIRQISALPVAKLAADDAHLHLWTTSGHLRVAFDVMDAWGFEYRSCFVWVKPGIGTGYYWRVTHEILLTAVRGDATRFNCTSLRSWAEFERGRHSQKPEEVRRMIERASPGPRIELFARSPVKGWTVWGDQIGAAAVP